MPPDDLTYQPAQKDLVEAIAAGGVRVDGAPRKYDRALFAYNHSMHYVGAVRRVASRMRRDDRTFLTYYAWQVYVHTANGVRRVTGPGLD